MNIELPEPRRDTVALAVKVVTAYVSHNSVPRGELCFLIRQVHSAVFKLSAGGGRGAAASYIKVKKATPAQIRETISDDALISLIDGKGYKTLKRHLRAHGLDPSSYRSRYGLPVDYPMTARSYGEFRSHLARGTGLGRSRVQAPPPTSAQEAC